MDKENLLPFANRHHNPGPDAGSTAKTEENGQKRINTHREWQADIAAHAASDPLSAWERYLQWAKDTEDDGEECKSILHQCLQELSPEMYKSDIRYLRLWMKYSGFLNIEQQHEMLLYLEESNVGRDHALFYLAFATFLEKTRDFDAALRIYQQGLSRGAAPVQKLKEHMEKFNARMARRNKEQSRNPAAKRKQQSTPYKSKNSAIPSADARTSLGRARRQDKERPGYDVSLLSTSDEMEPWSFEESRAASWQARHNARLVPVRSTETASYEPAPAEPSVFLTAVEEGPAAEDPYQSEAAPSPVPDSGVRQGSSTPCALSLGLSSPPFVSPFQPAQDTPSVASPSLTINTKSAMDAINSMFHDNLESEELAEPTLTFATRAAMGAIDSMCQGEIMPESPSPRDSQVPADLSTAGDVPDVPATLEEPGTLAAESEPCLAEPRPLPLVEEGDVRESAIIADPWDKSLREQLLDALQPPMQEWRSVHDDQEGNLDEALETLQELGDSEEFIELGTQALCVRRRMSQGAFASTFEVDIMDDNTGDVEDSLAVLKVEQPPCPWEFYVGHALRARLPDPRERSRFVEMKQLHLANKASFLFTGMGSYGTLQDLLNAYRARGQVMPETLVQFYAMELVWMARDMHSCQILHTDIQAENLLIRHPTSWDGWSSEDPGTWICAGLQLLDFGRAIDLALMPPGCSFSADCSAECFRCMEMQDGRPWTYQVDAYGIASVVHFMLFGEKYIAVQRLTDEKGTVTYRLKSPLKSCWAGDLWEFFFNRLLNHASLQSPPAWDELLSPFFLNWQSNPAQAKTLQTDLRKQAILLHKD